MKELILAHVEKAVVAVCGLVFILFVVQAARMETYDKVPEDFSEVTQKAKKNVERAEAEPIEVSNLLDLNSQLRAPVSAQGYNFLTPLRRQLNFGLNFREQPAVLTPRQPKVQSNRGLLPIYKTDLEKGERLTRKVPSSEARFAVDQVGAQAKQGLFAASGMAAPGMMSMLTGSGAMPGMPGMDPAMMGGASGMGGSYADPAMMGGGAYGGMGAMGGGYQMYEDMAAMSGMGMMYGNESMYENMGFAMPGMPGGEMIQPEMEAPKAVADRNRRTVLNRDVLKGKEEKPAEKDTKKKDKEEKFVEEYIVDMVGKHWVEVVASFPHSDQIKEYVEKLREPAPYVGLRYALAEVQRQELNASNEWSEWRPIPLKEQFSVISNAIAYEPEIYADVVMKGLCMNIPMLQTTYKELLTLPEFEEPVQATYEPLERYMNPRVWELEQEALKNPKKKTVRRNRPTPPAPPAQTVKKEDPKKAATQKLMRRSGTAKLQAPDEEDPKKKSKEPFNNRYMVKDAMIRFWDFTVVPGRRYRYRVRVRAFNPNYKRDDVADPSYNTRPFLVGAWSEPSEEVYVEPDVQWYAAEPAARTRTDRAEVEIHYWSRQMGEWITQEVTQRPGDVIGLSGISSLNTVVEWDDKDKLWVPKAVDLYKEQRFNTRDILLAVDGGREVVNVPTTDANKERRLTLDVPKEIIAVNEYGDLVRRDSYSDVNDSIRSAIDASYDDLVKELKSLAKPAAGPGAGAGVANPLDPLGGMMP